MNLFWVLSNRHNNTTGSFLGCLIEQIKSAWLYMLMGKYTLVLLSKCVAQWLMVLNISDQIVSNIRSIMLNKFRISYFYICFSIKKRNKTKSNWLFLISCYVYVVYFRSLWLFELLNHRKQNIFWKHDTIYVHNQCVCLELELGLFLIIHHNQHIIHLYCLFYYSIQVK